MTQRIVFGGQISCGKSTLIASVYRYLEGNGSTISLHEIDVYSDTIPCLLGEKEWADRKKRQKAWFNPTIKRVIDAFAQDDNDLVLGDLPGKISNPFLGKMIAPADGAVIVYRMGDCQFRDWEKLFTRLGIPILAYVCSTLNGQKKYSKENKPDLEKPLIYIRGLSRQIIATDEIKHLAELIS